MEERLKFQDEWARESLKAVSYESVSANLFFRSTIWKELFDNVIQVRFVCCRAARGLALSLRPSSQECTVAPALFPSKSRRQVHLSAPTTTASSLPGGFHM